MDITIDTREHLIARAADRIEALVRARPDAVLGVATGSTPEPLYAALSARAAAGLDLSGITLSSLDEYIGLAGSDPRSYRHYIATRIIAPWGLDPARVILPAGDAADPQAEARDFAAALAACGGVDLQILGLGTNGHIGFNEPGSPLDSGTRVVALSASTRQANARFFPTPEAVPTHAITQGVGTVMSARRLLLLALGEEKAAAVAGMVDGPLTADLPASVLQTHPAAEVLLDPAAASRLEGQAWA